MLTYKIVAAANEPTFRAKFVRYRPYLASSQTSATEPTSIR